MWAPGEASEGYSGGGGRRAVPPFDDLFFRLAVLAPLAGLLAFAGRFPVVLRAHILKQTPFFKYAPFV